MIHPFLMDLLQRYLGEKNGERSEKEIIAK
jgi:hypothetical protein